MKKKGFTLIELLATIVVLSVIALIATPIILNVIEKAKKGALVSSVNGLVESANMYYTNEIIKGDINEDVIFDFEEGIQTSESKLSYKGKVYNGKLILTSDSDVITCIDDGKYYAYKEKNSDEVISGIGTCLYDGTTGDFTIESDVDVIIKECDEDKKELQEQITNLTTTVNNLQQTINEKEQAISDLTSIKEGLENQVTTLEGEKEELLKQIENSNLSNSELNTKITKLEGTIATLESSIEAKNNEITTLNGEKTELQNQLTTKTNELKILNENLGKVTASASDVLSGKTILGSDGKIVTGTITSLAAKIYTPGTSNQTISSGKYLSGTQTIAGDADLISANIKSGANIFGVAGNANVVDTSSGDATAAQILSGKKAYVDGKLVTGTMKNLSNSSRWVNTDSGAFYTDQTYTYSSGTTVNDIVVYKYNEDYGYGYMTPTTKFIIGRSSDLASKIKSGSTMFGVTGTYTSDANATASQILKDKTAYVNGSKITGTMTNKAGTTTAASIVTESGNNALITIPANGYYSTSSKISVPIETIKSNVSSLNKSDIYMLYNGSISDRYSGVNINISDISGYQNFTTGNFIVRINSIYRREVWMSEYRAYPSVTYNSSTGVINVKIGESNSYSSGSETTGWSGSVTVYLITDTSKILSH